MRALGLAVVAGLLSALPAGAQAPFFTMARPIPDNKASPQVINGTKAAPKAWPATFIFDGQSGPCTATVVGPQTVLTAAHCVGHLASGKLKLGNSLIDIFCERHDGYDDGSYYYDIALCRADQPIRLPAGAPYESVSVAAELPPADVELSVLGYGCLAANGKVQSDVYQGTARITKRASPYEPIHETSGSATCNGDSGGAAYHWINTKKRVIVGVATHSNLAAASKFGAVSADRTAKFLTDWSARRVTSSTGAVVDARICGIDPGLMSCRG